jgi:hypothetical protein
MRELASLLARFLVVMGGTVAVLAALDRVPAAVAGATHGARLYRTLAEAEAALGARLLLPSYYPDSLAWPPARIEVVPGPPAVAAVRVAGRGGRREALVVCQSIGAPASPPAWLLAPLERLQETDVALGPRRARLARLLTPGGRLVHDLSWAQGDRIFTLRYEGNVEDLLLMGRAMERSVR